MELDITTPQALYLNSLARIANRYRITAEHMRADLEIQSERAFSGLVPTPPRHQDTADIVAAAGQLEALTSIAFTVFPFPAPSEDVEAGRAHETLVKGYLKAALTLGDGWILNKQK